METRVPDTIADAALALRAGTVTSVELTTAVLDRIARLDACLGAYVTVCAQTALVAAAAADLDFARGDARSPLQGIPLAVKDLIATKDAPTTANSTVLDPRWGEGLDAPVVSRLRSVGGVIVGKATTSEFACGLPDPAKRFAVPHNPWNLDYSPGGSSSGTSIAVAAGLALGGLGTDTAGSIRAPAAVNGHTGLKPSFGRVPKSGVVPCAYTLDTVGPMARSAYDCALILEVIAGYDASDPLADPSPSQPYASFLTGDLDGLRIGLPIPYFFDAPELSTEVRDAVLAATEELGATGASVSRVVLPYACEANDANNVTFLTEGFAYHRQDLMSRWADYNESTRQLFARAAFFTGADYVQAQRVRAVFRRAVAKLFESVDVLVTPASLTPAIPAIDRDMAAVLLAAGTTGQWNIAGLPAIAVPCGLSSSMLPLSMQIVGRPFEEATVLKVADAFQRATEWHLKKPPTDQYGIA